MPVLEIKSRYTGEVIYSGEALSMRELFENAVKDKASLNGASLNRASLNGASLYGASLNGAILDGANLNGANLNGASLNGASLNGASLNGASLNGASLNGAMISDDITISKQPLSITTTVYPVIIFDAHMQIGCKFYSLAEWWGFDNRAIAEMDGKRALEFWGKWKPALQTICEAEGRS